MTILSLDGSSVDGAAYTDVVDLARHAPGWLDGAVSAWSTYGLALFAALMAYGWWRARRAGAAASVTALATPFAVVAAYGVDAALKLLVREDRPCRSLRAATLEACPAPGDWSFPSNHAAVAAAAAVALLFVSRRLGALAVAAACAMAASRVWVGAHYPHDVLAGLAVGALTALLAMSALRHGRAEALALRLVATRLRPLLAVTP
ncbi:phosphatase PAP2 family protein [Streptomyces sp. IBSBF 2953]|uniref:phosphatase PAP2 family protein n=1 Tax=Streptomyces TaxID=1883 RepID=UPI00211A4E69|nr:phosphatase PAP2 family protein [Streptomyces scabiei]MCQ9178005.1 phosphatase PAP2 family protein [Streptomyces hayashii]MDX3117366.1 phosphatase PAP2 family protein [Streptomyces scabiei]